MPRLHLTDLAVRNLKPPATGQLIYTDTAADFKGFGLRIGFAGTKTFVLTHGKARKRVTLGRYPLISLAQARDKARDILTNKTNLIPTLTFEEALTLHLEVHCKPRQRASTYKEHSRLLHKHFDVLGSTVLTDITTTDITDIIDPLIRAPSTANHAFVAIRTFFRWALSRSYIQNDPLAALRKPTKEVSRDRTLDDHELASVLTAAPSRGTYGKILLMLILTGQRKAQIANLRRERIHGDTIVWSADQMKSGREHILPIGSRVAAILAECPEEGYLFPANRNSEMPFNTWSKTKLAFDDQCKLDPWVLHDLRRSFATIHAKMGTPPHIVERMLAHSTGTISGVAAIYNRHSYMDEMREATAQFDAYIADLS